MATAVPERRTASRFAGHGAEAVRDAIASTITTLPGQLRRSLTWDQGAEMAQHAQLRIDTGLAIYFCDPRGPDGGRGQAGLPFGLACHRGGGQAAGNRVGGDAAQVGPRSRPASTRACATRAYAATGDPLGDDPACISVDLA